MSAESSSPAKRPSQPVEALLPKYWPEHVYNQRLNRVLNLLHSQGTFQQRWARVHDFVENCEATDFQASIDTLEQAGYQIVLAHESPPPHVETCIGNADGSTDAAASAGGSGLPSSSPTRKELTGEQQALVERNRQEALAKRARLQNGDSPEKTQEIMEAMQWL
jgi:hypothetical protein